MEERKGQDGDTGNGCRALAVQGTGWHNMLVVVMGSDVRGDRKDSCSNSVCLSGLRLAQSSFGPEAWSPFLIACTR